MQPNIINYDYIDSTMDEARRLLEIDFEQYDNAVIVAKQQTNGRGRLGRQWISPEGNLYMSMVVRDVPLNHLSQFAILWGVVLHQVINSIVDIGHTVHTKWPNDILINEKKVGGILIERYENEEQSALIVGVGVNIIYAPKDVPFPAISLKEVAEFIPTVSFLAKKISSTYQILYRQWEVHGFLPIREKWLKTAWNLNKAINIRQFEKSVIGIFETVDLQGAIEIRESNGSVHRLLTGEVFNVINN